MDNRIMTMEPKVIKPAAGKWLTQASVEKEEDRFFSDMIFLGVHDKAENYIEQTDEQKKEWESNYQNYEEAE